MLFLLGFLCLFVGMLLIILGEHDDFLISMGMVSFIAGLFIVIIGVLDNRNNSDDLHHKKYLSLLHSGYVIQSNEINSYDNEVKLQINACEFKVNIFKDSQTNTYKLGEPAVILTPKQFNNRIKQLAKVC